jgi:hypothetical protein
MSGPHLIRLLLLGIGTFLWFAIGGELLCRFEGGWRLDIATLTGRPAAPPDPNRARESERALLATVTYQKGVDPAWFFLPPASIEKPASSMLRVRTAANPEGQQQQNYLWNDALLSHPDANLVRLLRRLKIATLFAFPSFDGSVNPPYRLYPDNDYRPTPWITNHWGWLSPEVTVKKPSRTIRVGIVGDSTSHNRYGFYLQGFLDAWARAHGLDIRFEVMNAARQGLGFEDEMAALKYELGPMGLDYVYEYFAPNFSLSLQQMVAFATLPPGVEAGKPPLDGHPRLDAVRRALDPLTPVSALARSIRDGIVHEAADSSLYEPGKPRVKLHLPPVSGGKVVIEEVSKDPYFWRLLVQLSRFKVIASSLNAKPLLSTERLCVWDGMVLRNGSSRALYQKLNGPQFWPFSYADLRRVLAVHNSAISTWAAANGVIVVDIDGRLPRLPELYIDPYHDVAISQQLRAWLIFQAMVPQLEHDLANKLVPHDNAEKSGLHPYLDKPIEVLDRNQWLARVEEQSSAKGATVVH